MSSSPYEFSTIAQKIELHEDRFVQKTTLGGYQMNEIPVSKIESVSYSAGVPIIYRPSLKFKLRDGSNESWFLLGWIPKLTGHYPDKTELIDRMNEILNRRSETEA